MKTILESCEEGIFFLNRKFKIEEQYSKFLEKVINQEKLSGECFISFLKRRVPDKVVKDTEEYLKLMFRNDLDEETINELNPLSEIEFHFEDESGLWTSSKHFSFKFIRINTGKEIVRLISTVKDITEKITLSKKLGAIKEDTKKQLEWLVNIMHIEPPLLKEFINVSEQEINLIDKELKNTKDAQKFNPILNKILRTLHQMQNNADLLSLSFFHQQIVKFESTVVQISNKKDIIGTDFVPVVIQLGKLKEMINDIKILMQRLKHFKNSLRPTRRFEGGLLVQTIEKMVKQLSRESGREIEFNFVKFDSLIIPYQLQEIVREFLIILIRFSIFYGLEKPDDRKAANKKPMGTLEIETFIDRKNFGFKLRHDGRLIRIERLLHQTIESAETTKPDDNEISQTDHIGSEVVRLLFMPSMATSNLIEAEYSKEIFRDMELVKKKLKMRGGKIKITFTSEEFCEYIITLPLK